jgi:hypothetical protein
MPEVRHVYPWPMARKPAEGQSQPAAEQAQAADAPPDGDAERVGPLRLTRQVKPDGRALLLFARADEPQP